MSFDADQSQAPKADDCSNTSEDFLQRAARAVDAGDAILGVHLYLAAFERALDENLVPSVESLSGMQEAWRIAVSSKQRSLAEYIFERLEPFLSEEATAQYADELQRLAFDKLEDLGIPREALEGMAGIMGQDVTPASGQDESFMGFDLGADGLSGLMSKRIQDRGGTLEEPDAAAQNEGGLSDALRASQEELRRKLAEGLSGADGQGAGSASADVVPAQPTPKKPKVSISQIVIPPKEKTPAEQKRFNYQDLCGFDRAIARMAEMGVGHRDDAAYRNFVKMLNNRHGLTQPPVLGTLMFVSDAREDAGYFMAATAGELKVPAVRMRFDRNSAGQTVLVVMASPDFPARLGQVAQHGFPGPAAVILEDIDCWQVPELDVSLDEMNMSNLMQVQVSRGAREALTFLSVALATPEVTVMASCSDVNAIDPYFGDLLGAYAPIEIDLPTAEERKSLWRKAQTDHPSLRGLDVLSLVSFSRGMSRYEILAIANEAVENAYRESLARQRFCAVQTSDVIMRLSSFHALDSSEYAQMEDQLMSELSRSLDGGIDALLGGR